MSLRTVEVYKSENLNRTDRHCQDMALNPDLKRRQAKSNLIEWIGGLIFMLVSYRRMFGFTLLVGFLGGTFVYAEPLKIQQRISDHHRDNMTVLTIGWHGAGPFYSGKKSHGLTDFLPDDPAENSIFDIFCSSGDSEWFRPGQNSSPQQLRGSGPKPPMQTQRRHQLRPC